MEGLIRKRLKANMSAAVDQCIKRVDGTPSMKTKNEPVTRSGGPRLSQKETAAACIS